MPLLTQTLFFKASSFGTVSNRSPIKRNVWNTNNYGNRSLSDTNNKIM